MDAALADATAVVHVGFLVFVVVGGFLALRWRWVLVPHLVAAAWGLAITVFGFECPLTAVENHFRNRAGDGDLPGGFIDTYIEGVIYPQQYVEEARLAAAVVVLVSYALLVRQLARRSTVTPRV